MLQASTTESEQKRDVARTAVVPKPRRTLNQRHSDTRALDGPTEFAPRSDAAQLRIHFAGLQRTIGNHAVLRMLSRPTPAIQTKLTVNRPGDQYEQEADRVADQVVRMPGSDFAPKLSSTSGETPGLQRKCSCGGSGGECEACKQKREAGLLQRKPGGTPATDVAAPAIVHEVLRSPGQPLDAATRAFFEPRFGYDFGQVKVHNDVAAASSAQAVGAHAYTVGHNIVFGTRQYAPGSTWGQRLLAHELTHVVQHSGFQSKGPAAGLQRAAAPPTTNVDSMPLEEAVKNTPSLSQDDALKVLKRFQAFIRGRITSGEGRIRELMALRAESFANYLIGGTIDLFGLTSLPSDDWQVPWKHLNDAYGTIAKRDVRQTLNHLVAAAKATNEEWTRLNKYLESTEKGADRSIFVLQGLEVAGSAAATALTGGLGGAVYAGGQRLAGEVTSTQIGLQKEIDWAGVVFDTLFAAVAGKLGGNLGGKLSGQLEKAIISRLGGELAAPLAKLGGKAAASLISSLIVGRASGITHAVALEVFNIVRGKTRFTVDEFIDRIAQQLTLRAVFLDLLAHAVGTVGARATAPKPSSTEPRPETPLSPEARRAQFKVIRGEGSGSAPRRSQGASYTSVGRIVRSSGAAALALPAVDYAPEPQFPSVVPDLVPEPATPAAEPAALPATDITPQTNRQPSATTTGTAAQTNVQTGVAIAAATAGQPKTKCPYPTGLTRNDPIAMDWYKPRVNDWYPPSITLDGHSYSRDEVTPLPRGDGTVGVAEERWPRIGKLLQLDPECGVPRQAWTCPNASRFRAVLTSYGFQWGGPGGGSNRRYLQADHVQDVQWGDPDAANLDDFTNLWPMDGAANASAGSLQNLHQPVHLCDAPNGQALDLPIGEVMRLARAGAQFYGRYFRIRKIVRGPA
jgi:hypothetical protein